MTATNFVNANSKGSFWTKVPAKRLVNRSCQFFLSLLFLAVLGSPAPALPAQNPTAQFDERAAADFYRGKIVRIVVGFPPGGGADVYSRLIARHLGRFVPGNPTLTVSNMPGAGSIIAGNHIFNSGAKDGTEIGMLNGAAILEQLFESSEYTSIWRSFAIRRCR